MYVCMYIHSGHVYTWLSGTIFKVWASLFGVHLSYFPITRDSASYLFVAEKVFINNVGLSSFPCKSRLTLDPESIPRGSLLY